MTQLRLTMPIFSSEPEHNHQPEHVLSLSQFLDLLKEEEDYFKKDREDMRLTITRLRKIFYDKWGWDTVLIRNAAAIKGRYDVEVSDCSNQRVAEQTFAKIKLYTNYAYTPKCRFVTYSKNDLVYSHLAGQTPEIYKFDHVDVKLPENYHCDLGHVLAGIDALNHPNVISPLPNCLLYLYKCLPYANSNADVVTWLGDIATASADFVFDFLKNGKTPLHPEKEQYFININASSSDMLGNIDGYVLHHYIYKSQKFKGKTFTEILREYYADDAAGDSLRSLRFHIFTEKIGLRGWNGEKFSNETTWINYYENQLRSTISFMIYHFISDTYERYGLPYLVWRKKYEDVIKTRDLLTIFLNELKLLIL